MNSFFSFSWLIVLCLIVVVPTFGLNRKPSPNFDWGKYAPYICEDPLYETPELMASRHALTPDIDPFIGTGGDGYG